MAVYRVVTDRPKIPAARMVADDPIELGEQVAAFLARHGALARHVPYDAWVGDHSGVIHQSGLSRPINFTLDKEA